MTRIGILSDTHDNLPLIEKAVQYFNSQQVSFVLHAGDYIAPFSVLRLKKLSCQWRGVLGNNDGEVNGLIKASDNKIKDAPMRVELAGRKIVVVHDLQSIDPDKEKAQLIIFGHTHKPQISSLFGKILVNPGEASGWLSGIATVALADLDNLSAQIITL